jgi:hypothetical protein
MSRPRFCFIALALVLMQILAPWVHAHTGGETMGGFLHLPGLEFLDKADAGYASQDRAAAMDVIVGVQTGIQPSDSGFKFTPDSGSVLSPVPAHLPTQPHVRAQAMARAGLPVILPAVFRYGAPPRASPAVLSHR